MNINKPEKRGYLMWNVVIPFEAALARPKHGIRLTLDGDYMKDLENAVHQANLIWSGDREFVIHGLNGLYVKMEYHALDPIRNNRTIIKHFQKISQILAHEMKWNELVTRKMGTIFTLQFPENLNIKEKKLMNVCEEHNHELSRDKEQTEMEKLQIGLEEIKIICKAMSEDFKDIRNFLMKDSLK